MAKAFEIVLKVVALLPVIVEIVGSIEDARKPDSPGGAKLTSTELAQLIVDGGSKFVKKLAEVFGHPA